MSWTRILRGYVGAGVGDAGPPSKGKGGNRFFESRPTSLDADWLRGDGIVGF
jgi:hypothetical protein